MITARCDPDAEVQGLSDVGVSDGVLVSRAQDGDSDAFEELVLRHYPGCLRYATRMLGNRADAEEVVQDTFVRAYRALPRYQPRDRFHAWLYRILINRCRTVGSRGLRSARRLHDYRVVVGPSVAPAPAVSDGLLEPIMDAMFELSAEYREAFLLKYVEELSYEEMAELTGAGISALKMRVKRARERLQALLGDLDV